MRLKLIFIVVLLIGTACTEAPEPDEKIARLYVDILRAEETFYTGLDSLQIVRDSIFISYGIAEDEYNSTIRNYASNSETWKKFYEMSMTYIDSLATKADDRN